GLQADVQIPQLFLQPLRRLLGTLADGLQGSIEALLVLACLTDLAQVRDHPADLTRLEGGERPAQRDNQLTESGLVQVRDEVIQPPPECQASEQGVAIP